MICVLKTLEKTILNDIVLMGIQNITGATMECDKNYIVYDKDSDEFKKKKILFDKTWQLRSYLFDYTINNNNLSLFKRLIFNLFI